MRAGAAGFRLFDVGTELRLVWTRQFGIRSGDGPVVFIILFAGFLVVTAALIVEVRYQPPYGLHFVMWMPIGLILPLFMLRPFKGVLVARQYKHKAEEGRLDDSD